MLHIYNTLARTKQAFTPLEPGKVRMYVCGMTVYDHCHIGHARVLVAFDAVRRWLIASGLQVTFVRNITDIDDKIIRRAVENGETIRSLTDRFIAAMHEDEAALGVLPPDFEPRATEFVPQMLSLVGRLRDNGLAYASEDGDVHFAVRRFPGYGRLSGKSLDDLRAGQRVAVNDAKEDPLDFVLWKASAEADPEEVRWASPFGSGRPGWHIECSAMATELLGAQFDIHGGGADLQFPHHENEIAQSDGALHPEGRCSFVQTWMHNGFVQIDNQKMSKSLGNFFTVRDVLGHFAGEVVRFFILRAHYRSPLNYADALLDDARETLLRLYAALEGTPMQALNGVASTVLDRTDPLVARFAAALDDDFNTPLALSVLHELASRIHRDHQPADVALLRQLGGVLGLLQADPDAVRRSGLRGPLAQPVAKPADHPAPGGPLHDAQIDALVQERLDARAARDFARADGIRTTLLQAGIELQDNPGGTIWRRK